MPLESIVRPASEDLQIDVGFAIGVPPRAAAHQHDGIRSPIQVCTTEFARNADDGGVESVPPASLPRRKRHGPASASPGRGISVAGPNLHGGGGDGPPVEFPPFELLHWFEDAADGYLHISHSEILGFRFSEFGRALPDLNLGEAFPRGSPKLRSLIGAHHQVWPESVLVCNGASEANFLVQAALLRPGDEAIAEVPLYPPLRDGMAGLGADVKRAARLPGERWRLDVDALEGAITEKTRLVVLTNLNNPTSGILAEYELRRLADLAEAHGFHVLIDETFRELAFEQAPPTASAFSPRFIVTSTLTKAFGLGGLRLGWVVGPPDVIAKVKGVKDYASICPNRISEELATWALERKEGFLARAKRIVTENRQLVRAWLERNPAVECHLPDYGNLCFPKLSVSVDALADRLKQQFNVVIAPGRFFGMNDHFRLGYGGRATDLKEGLERLDLMVKTFVRRQKAEGTVP